MAETQQGEGKHSIVRGLEGHPHLSHLVRHCGETVARMSAAWGGGGGVGSLPSGAIATVSSLLMSELAHSLHLSGFEGGLFTTVGTTITSQLVTNAYGMMTGASLNGAPYTMFTGFDTGAIFTQLEGAVAGYLGSTLAAHITMPHYAEGATGQQIGSSVGGLVGTWFGGPVGAFLGSLAGGALRRATCRSHMRLRAPRHYRVKQNFRNGSLQKGNEGSGERDAPLGMR